MVSTSTIATTVANAFAVVISAVAADSLSEVPLYAPMIQNCDISAPIAWRGIMVLRIATFAPTARTDVATIVTQTVDETAVIAAAVAVTADVDVVATVAEVVDAAPDASVAVGTTGAEMRPSHYHAIPPSIARKSLSRRLRW